MLELERRRLKLIGKKQSEITDSIKGYTDFYTDYLIRQMTPKEVLKSKPHLAPLWYEAPEHQYGRPASFYHQLQNLNLAAAWEKVEVPVLVMHGEYDWIMSREDHQLITDIVNERAPNRATFVELPKTDHVFMTAESIVKSFEGESGQYNKTITEQVLRFLRANQQTLR
jgi:pimeloyl-ACP methyl ester carboxylesterase